jgi:hypothetical protein
VALRPSVARIGIAACLVAPAAVACHLLVPAGELTKGPPDASVSDAPVVPDTSVDPCGPLVSAPEHRDDPPGRRIEFAAVKFSLSPTADDLLCKTRGFDLDGLTTSGGARCQDNRACAPRSEATIAGVFPCDGPDGEDDAFGAMYARIKTFAGGGASAAAYDINNAVAAGLTTSLMELHEYSGAPDDEHVIALFYGAAGIEGVDAAATSPSEVGELQQIWDGGQDFTWIVSRDSVNGRGKLAEAKGRTEGFVRDNVLVIPNTGALSIPVILGGRPIRASGGSLMGRIVPPTSDFNRYRLTHVRLGIRVASQEVLSMIGARDNPENSDVPLCAPESQPIYEAFFRSMFCAHVDLPANGGPPDAAAPCGDLSVGVHLWYVESRIRRDDGGYIMVGDSVPIGTTPPCADAGTQWCDDCEWDASRRCELPDAATD